MAYEKGATDFVNWMYRKYPEAVFVDERAFTKNGENFVNLIFDLSNMNSKFERPYDEIFFDDEISNRSVNVAAWGKNDSMLVVTCYDDETWDEFDESYKRESKRLNEYVNEKVQKAWDLLDDWFEREWGEIPYNESAKSILVTEFPMDIFVDGDFVEGTGAVVLDLINCTAYYAVYDENGDMYADNTDTYSNIQDMIDKLIQPMADGEITEDDFIRKCENLVY